MTNITKQYVFVVDDEPKVRKMVGRTLEQAGFKVSCFARAVECLKQLHSQTCDVLITDVKMPEMDGIELLTKVKRIICKRRSKIVPPGGTKMYHPLTV